MKAPSFLLILLLLGGMESLWAQSGTLELTIIYDNYSARDQLHEDWGFACLVECEGEQLLFDAGRKEKLYRENMTSLDIHPATIPALFISHHHDDHTAGIPWISEVNPDIRCYLPDSYLETLREKQKLPPHAEGHRVPAHLYGPFYTTGDGFETFREQGLVVKTSSGGILITGCGHPGPLDMIEVAEEELGIEIHTMIGGLHLLRKSDKELDELVRGLREAGIQKICATHCTGNHAMEYLAEAFGEDFIRGGSGQKVILTP